MDLSQNIHRNGEIKNNGCTFSCMFQFITWTQSGTNDLRRRIFPLALLAVNKLLNYRIFQITCFREAFVGRKHSRVVVKRLWHSGFLFTKKRNMHCTFSCKFQFRLPEFKSGTNDLRIRILSLAVLAVNKRLAGCKQNNLIKADCPKETWKFCGSFVLRIPMLATYDWHFLWIFVGLKFRVPLLRSAAFLNVFV